MKKVKPKVLVILGPTSSGKSDLAVHLAKKFKGEVVSADSRQVYRGLDLLSGKITQKEMAGVRHHLLDVASPKRIFTVSQYQKLASHAVEDILKRGKLPIICGGTGLYIDAVLYHYHFPEIKPNLKLRRRLEKLTTEELFKKLKESDPVRARGIDQYNRRRLVRALEILASQKKIPAQNKVLKKESPYEIFKIGLNPPATVLKEKIQKRLAARLQQGMMKEAQRLVRSGISHKRLEALGLESRFISYFLEKKFSRQGLEERLALKIRQYAKRQMTWFKRDTTISWHENPKNKNIISETKRYLSS